MTPTAEPPSRGDPGSCSALGASLLTGAKRLQHSHPALSTTLVALGSELQRYAVSLRGAELLERHRDDPSFAAARGSASGPHDVPKEPPPGSDDVPNDIPDEPIEPAYDGRSAAVRPEAGAPGAARARGRRADPRWVAAARRGRAERALRQVADAAGGDFEAVVPIEGSTATGTTYLPRPPSVRGNGGEHPRLRPSVARRGITQGDADSYGVLMEMNDTIEYRGSVEDVFAMLTDEAFQARKCVETKAVRHEVKIHQNGDSTVIDTKRAVPTDRFPDFARRIVGRTITIVQQDVWHPAAADGSRSGTIHVTVEGVPIWLKGTLLMQPTSEGTHEEIKGTLHASIPLVGGRLEHACMPALEGAVNAEERVGRQWLQEREA